MKTTKDAVENFNGVWPYGDNYSYMMQSPQGYYRQSGASSIGEFEILVCTRDEFETCAGSKL